MNRLTITVLAVLGLLCLGLSGAAMGAVLTDVPVDPDWYLSATRSVLAARAWVPALGLCVLGLVALLRWQRVRLVGKLPWLATRAGGWTLNIVLALFGALGIGLYSHIGGREIVTACVQAMWAAVIAAGTLEAVKDRLTPKS